MKKSINAGFSLIEILVVVSIIAILLAFAVPQFWRKNLHSAEDQARKIQDFLDEARQKALNQRKTFRVEINKSKSEVRLIDEGDNAATADDDKIIRKETISKQVSIGSAPSNVLGSPAATSPIPVPSYSTSSYPLSSGDEKITLRFKRNGQVFDAGTDNTGTGSAVTGATIYVNAAPKSGNNSEVIRAVTVLGTTGDTSLYKCTFVSDKCTNWSR